MIKVDATRIDVEGKKPEILAEMVCVIEMVKECLEEDFGKEGAEEMVCECVGLAFVDKKEFRERVKKYVEIAKKRIKEMLRENRWIVQRYVGSSVLRMEPSPVTMAQKTEP